MFSISRSASRSGAFASGVLLLVVMLAARLASAESHASDTQLESYSVGHQIGMDLVRQARQVEMDALLRGLRDGLAGREPSLPASEIEALLLELKRGIVTDERADRIGGAPSLRRAGEAFMAENAKREGVVALPSGLQYRIIRPGGGPHPTAHDTVVVRYRSTRLDGTAFHDSTKPGSQPEALRVGELIGGLREAVPLMSVGARWELFLPPQLAFRRRGPLADHTVIYDLELLEVRSPESSTKQEGE